jgi:hypothetical protein
VLGSVIVGESRATVQYHFQTPPRAGQCANLSVTNAAANTDLRTLGVQTPDISQSNVGPIVGAPGHFATFEADGSDIYVIFGPTAASVSGGNAPVIATTGVNVAGVCFKVTVGNPLRVKLEAGVDNFVGYIASAAGPFNLRVYISSV